MRAISRSVWARRISLRIDSVVCRRAAFVQGRRACAPIRITVNTPAFTYPVRVILLDIEGTTTPIAFVYDVLFPYARKHVKAFLSAHRTDAGVQADIEQLIAENARDTAEGAAVPKIENHDDEARLASIAAYAEWLMDQDRKTTPLKSLQGRIWEAGYRAGELHSQIFADVPRALARWCDEQRDICIYSSGSVLAQQLLFSHTEAGNLRRFIRDYFDTTTGAKREAESYRRIAAALDCAPSDLLFISDVAAELDAARDAGLQTLLCIRPGNPSPPPSTHRAIQSFDEVFL